MPDRTQPPDHRQTSGETSPAPSGTASGTTARAIALAGSAQTLGPEEIARYSRHLILPEVGMEGQTRLKRASVLLVGTGGLGAPVGLYLAAAGVGRLGLVDFDVVDHSNLHRQIIHGTRDVGRSKLASARDSISDINPNVEIECHEVALSAQNALEIVPRYDLVIDGTDNFPTRYLVNDACVLLGKPNVYGSIFRFEGQASVFWAEQGPCYRCLFPEPPPPGLVPSCAEGGVLGVLPGIIGMIQATEAVKLILGLGEPLIGRLLLYDALSMRFRELKLRKDENCVICGSHASITELIDYEQFCGIAPAGGPGEASFSDELEPRELESLLQEKRPITLVDVRNPSEWEICRIEGARLIPLPELDSRLDELRPDDDIVVYCKRGIRGDNALAILKGAGFTRVRNLRGGILAWAEEVDPGLPRY